MSWTDCAVLDQNVQGFKWNLWSVSGVRQHFRDHNSYVILWGLWILNAKYVISASSGLSIKTKSPLSDSPPEAMAAGEQVKLTITLITSQISPGLSIVGNIWDNLSSQLNRLYKKSRWHFNAESSHITCLIPISTQFGRLNGWMCSSSDVLSNDFRSRAISFFITTTLLRFPCHGISPSKVFNCIACLPWDHEWSWCGQRWAADCIVKQPAGCRVSWQAESGLAPSCLAYNWPGEDVKWNLSRVRVMEEKTSHVFIREEMREGREGKTGGVDIIQFRKN